MSIKDTRGIKTDELKTKLEDTRQELMNLRFQIETGQQTDTSRLKITRRLIAQYETILRERELGLNKQLEKAAEKEGKKVTEKEVKKATAKEDKKVAEIADKKTAEKEVVKKAQKPAKKSAEKEGKE